MVTESLIMLIYTGLHHWTSKVQRYKSPSFVGSYSIISSLRSVVIDRIDCPMLTWFSSRQIYDWVRHKSQHYFNLGKVDDWNDSNLYIEACLLLCYRHCLFYSTTKMNCLSSRLPRLHGTAAKETCEIEVNPVYWGN